MDLIDKRILCELDINCRIPYSQLARKLRIGRNVAAYRIKKLEEEKIITRYVCALNLGSLGYKTSKIYIKIKSKGKQEERFRQWLMEKKNVIHCLQMLGMFDYSFAVAVKSVHELDAFLSEMKNTFSESIATYEISSVVYTKVFKLDKLLLGETKETLKVERYSGEEGFSSLVNSLDEKDIRILKVLSQQANLPIIALAQKTKLSVDIVAYRLQQLSKSIVSAYRITLNLNKLGYFHYLFLLRMKRASKEEEERLVMWCTLRKNVLYCTKRIGAFDFEINVALRDIPEVQHFLAELKKEFGEEIDAYETLISTELLKFDYVVF